MKENTIRPIGNSGSAAEAQHFVAELVVRFKQERAPYAAIALTSDSVTLTAITNDYGYQGNRIFCITHLILLIVRRLSARR
jgi:phosphoheptose isomerase